MNLAGCFKWGCGGVLAIGALLFLASLIFATGTPFSGSTATSSSDRSRTIKSEGWVGCPERAEYERLSSLSDDRAAWQKALLSSNCRILSQGASFVLTDSQGSLVQIRLQGETAPLWTPQEVMYR